MLHGNRTFGLRRERAELYSEISIVNSIAAPACMLVSPSRVDGQRCPERAFLAAAPSNTTEGRSSTQAQHNIGVLSMKPMGAQVILRSGVVNASECLRYAMSLPTSVVITGCDSMAILQQAINIARSFRPMTDEERTALLARTAPVAGNGNLSNPTK